MLTTSHTDDLVIQALNAGAPGFLLKDLSGDESTAGVRKVAAGGTVMSPEVTAKVDSRAQARTHADFDGTLEKIANLTESERDVLALIGAGHTNLQIAETLHVCVTAVKTQTARMLGRLGLEQAAFEVACDVRPAVGGEVLREGGQRADQTQVVHNARP